MFNMIYADHKDIDFEVIYYAETEPNRQWVYLKRENAYPHRFMKSLYYENFGFSSYFSYRSFFEKINCECLILGGSWTHLNNWILACRAKISGTRVIFWSESHAKSIARKNYIIRIMRKCFYKIFDGYLCPNHEAICYIKNNLGIDSPIYYFPNTIDERQYARNIEGRCISIDPMVKFVTVARLEHFKGVVELIKEFNNINKKNNWHLTIVGDGSLRNNVKQIISDLKLGDKIELVAHVDPKDMPQIYKEAHVFLLNTFRDPSPLSLVEAAFCGLMLGTTKFCGNSALLVTEKNGFIAKDDGGILSRDLELILEMPIDKIKSKGCLSIELAKSHCSIEIVADVLRKLNKL
ncbi:glycosyltransferase family 4 protein [Limnobacter parvus]|uniref:Glycosyltransferase family 4 protein n=1 Tax=Limnobacter parvus TaxID=2939690 RepID=A0ABT1XE75_9BURK|nr:glycosyltransferase family 4 protein [Limnobacter parvus]MCR2745216.1 glycosyltransferase family 4 protein [Limnobacter parvus]